MEEDKRDEQELESSPNEDEENSESSTEEQNQDGEATPEKAPEKETPFHEHPRFKELVSEKNEYKQQTQDLQSKLLDITQKVTTKEEPEANPYEGLSQEEKVFYENLDKRVKGQIDNAVNKARKEERKSFQGELSSVYKAYGELAANEFLRAHQDIKRGSPEMEEIRKEAFSINKNPTMKDLDRAYKIVMFEKSAQLAVDKERKKHQQKIEAKKKANVEQKSIPDNALKKEAADNLDDAFKSAESDLDFQW